MSKSDKKCGTFIHGIATSQALDSSGERIIIDGVDISSLVDGNGGVFNYEHKSDTSSQIVGKILEAKKILKRSDCTNDDHRYFWDKIKIPFVYVSGELFDAVDHSGAKDVAAMLQYDEKNKDKKRQLINFSIEGSRLEKRGSEITKCIARKVTITLTPCNHTAYAEMKSAKQDGNEDSDHFSFINDIIMEKGEHVSSVELCKNMPNYTPKRTFHPSAAPENIKVGDRLDPKAPKPEAKPGQYGKVIIKNKEKEVEKVDRLAPEEQRKLKNKQRKFFAQKQPNVTTEDKKTKDKVKAKIRPKRQKLGKYESNVRKALTASAGVGAAPSTLSQGAALQGEELVKLNKKQLKQIVKSVSEEAFQRLDKKEELMQFLNSRFPSLDSHQKMALAKTIAYVREKKHELTLNQLIDDQE